MLDLLSDPGALYRAMAEAGRRHHNQAWFTRIYIDAQADDRDDQLHSNTDRTEFSRALEDSPSSSSSPTTNLATVG